MKNLITKIKEFFSGENGLMKGVAVGVGVIIVIALCEFLFYKGNNIYNGWQILMNQTFGEWLRIVVFSILAGGVVWGFIKYYNRVQDVKSSTILLFSLVLFSFLGIAYGKGCTDKANDAVTSGKGRPDKVQPDPNRMSAEEMLRIADSINKSK